jgi:hypothetical protein
MANLVADSGCNKGQLSYLVEAVCRDFRQHDKGEIAKIEEWQRLPKTSDKPARPETALYFPPADCTRAAFIQNGIALEKFGSRTQYLNMPEVEMADGLCGGHKQVSHMLRNIYDVKRAGALRATDSGVTGDPTLRVCLTLSATPFSARKFYERELHNGTFGRMVFSYKPRSQRDGRIPRLGKFDEAFYQRLDAYLERLGTCKGRFVIRPLNKLADQLAQDIASLADLVDDDILWDMSKRALHSAWKAGCILWVLNNQEFSKSIADMVEWLLYRDIWSKMQIFADMLGKDADQTSEALRRGPKNMLDSLPDTFSAPQLEALRMELGKSKEGAATQLRQWLFRKFITYSAQTGLYSKTDDYLKRLC